MKAGPYLKQLSNFTVFLVARLPYRWQRDASTWLSNVKPPQPYHSTRFEWYWTDLDNYEDLVKLFDPNLYDNLEMSKITKADHTLLGKQLMA